MLLFNFTFNDLNDRLTSINDLKFIPFPLIFIIMIITTLLFPFILKLRNPKPSTYLVDFSCYKAKCSQKLPKELMIQRMRLYGYDYNEESINFSEKLLERSGLGPSTYAAEALLQEPPNACLEEARKEAEAVMFGAVDELLTKTGVKAGEIGIVVVNCSVFNPVPSLSAMIVNRYGLREDVLSYNLSGMGCTAGLAAIGLAKQLLKVHHNTYALVVSTENNTENVYWGNNRAMLVTNCVFRVGGAAILLSNRPSDRLLAKYELIHTVHTHTAGSDTSYNCIFQEEDSQGMKGITITKDLIAEACRAIEANLTTLGPLLLPISDQLLFAANYLIRKLHLAKIKPYIPNFRGCVDHFFPHVGGKPVLDDLQKNLKFSEYYMEPSRMTLYRFGNTSSSSIWYEMAYSEAKGRIKKGDRVWQIAFGSGFKCSSAIWRVIKTIDHHERHNPWSDEIDAFPVNMAIVNGSFPYFFEQSKNS
ncbi:hypothetical protein Ancab_020169 [Ancistrocladus abbreviatus]